MERQIVDARLNLIVKYLNRLQGFESVNFEEYLDSFDLQIIAERLIQLTVDSASDINSYLLVELYQTTPESYYASFIEAGKKGIITKELAAQLAQSAGMRNRLVHQYDEIDHQIVFAAIPKALQQYPLYIQQIAAYLDSLEVKNE